jgi:elongation factor Ts
MGKLGKFYEQVCLVDQPYIRDQKIKVSDKLKSLEKELGGKITIADFVRYECGEGIEKKADDFAAEVENMLK